MLLATAWALSSQRPEPESKTAFYQFRELCSFVYSTNIFKCLKGARFWVSMIVNRSSMVRAPVEFTV